MTTDIRYMDVDGLQREFVIHVPDAFKNAIKKNMIVSLHPGGIKGPQWFKRVWGQRHVGKDYIVVCPTAHDPADGATMTQWVAIMDDKQWPVTDVFKDERFLVALVNRLVEQYKVDSVFLCGFSSGAKMAYHMLHREPGLFSGFGMTGHGPNQEEQDNYLGNLPDSVIMRISCGTRDDNFANPGPGLLDFAETVEYFGNVFDTYEVNRSREHGSKTTAFTRTEVGASSVFQYAKIRGMEHHWPEVSKGDPFNEDEELIKFWTAHAGF